MSVERLVYTVGETAEALGISAGMVRKMIRQGEIPVLELGTRRVIPKRWVDQKIDDAIEGVA